MLGNLGNSGSKVDFVKWVYLLRRASCPSVGLVHHGVVAVDVAAVDDVVVSGGVVLLVGQQQRHFFWIHFLAQNQLSIYFLEAPRFVRKRVR